MASAERRSGQFTFWALVGHWGTVLGEYSSDLFVEGSLIVEHKAVKSIANEHIAQVLGYRKSSRIETGLLITFGASILYVKKYLMTQD